MVSSVETNIVKEDFKEKYSLISKNLILNRPILLIFLIYYVYLSNFFEYSYVLWISFLPRIVSFILYVLFLIPYTFLTILIDFFPFLLDFLYPI